MRATRTGPDIQGRLTGHPTPHLLQLDRARLAGVGERAHHHIVRADRDRIVSSGRHRTGVLGARQRGVIRGRSRLGYVVRPGDHALGTRGQRSSTGRTGELTRRLRATRTGPDIQGRLTGHPAPHLLQLDRARLARVGERAHHHIVGCKDEGVIGPWSHRTRVLGAREVRVVGSRASLRNVIRPRGNTLGTGSQRSGTGCTSELAGHLRARRT